MEVRRFRHQGDEPPVPEHDPEVEELVALASRPLELEPETETLTADAVEIFIGEMNAAPFVVVDGDHRELARVEKDGTVVAASAEHLREAVRVLASLMGFEWVSPSTSSSSITPDAPS